MCLLVFLKNELPVCLFGTCMLISYNFYRIFPNVLFINNPSKKPVNNDFFSHYKFWANMTLRLICWTYNNIKKQCKLKNTCALIWACMFNYFFKKSRPVCQIRSVCLLIYRKFSLLYAYSEQTSIRDSRVGSFTGNHLDLYKLSRIVANATSWRIWTYYGLRIRINLAHPAVYT
jgi:hypothetical protein